MEQGGFASAVYPGREGGELPIPSVRLKAFRRGQQDVEYLAILLASRPANRAGHVAEFVRKALKVEGQKQGTGFTSGEDAGVIDFDRLKPQQLCGSAAILSAE